MDDLTTLQILEQETQETDPQVGENGIAYIRFEQGRQWVTHAVRSKPVRTWLSQKALGSLGFLPSARLISLALDKLTAEANETGYPVPVVRRLYNDEECTYLHLGSDRTLMISAEGYEVLGECGVIFPTDPTLLPLPEPVAETEVLATLTKLLGLDEQQTLLILAFLMACFQPGGRFPPLIVTGPPKSGKTRLAASIRQILDPAQAPLLALPSKLADFNALAANNSVLAFDNVSRIVPAFGVAIMALAEGMAQFDRRKGTTSNNKVPTIVVCEDLSCAGDLARNAVVIRLKDRSGDAGSRHALDRAFANLRPRALGALAGLAVKAKAFDGPLARESDYKDDDLGLWLLAVDEVLGAKGRLMDVYRAHAQVVLADLVAENPVLSAFMAMLQEKSTVTATAMDMQDLIEPFMTNPKEAGWPKGPKEFAKLLRNSAKIMSGVDIRFNVRTGKGRDRMIVAAIKEPKMDGAAAPSPTVCPAKARQKTVAMASQLCLI